MINNMPEIGARIKKKREELRHKQQSFATKIKIDKSSLNRYEKGTQTPSVETLVAIANGLEVSLDYLVYGTGEENTERRRNDDSDLRKSLKAMVTLIENGFMVVVNSDEIEGIAINLKRIPPVLEFFDEVANFCKCRDRMDESSYQKGIDKIVSEYESRIIIDTYSLHPMGIPDYSLIKKYEEQFNKEMESLKNKYGKPIDSK